MSRKWTDTKDIADAFTAALGKAVIDPATKQKLLDPAKAKKVVEQEGKITIPPDVEVVFYREEDLPLRLVVAIPTDGQGENGPNPLQPTFADCWKCTYETYINPAKADEFRDILRDRGIT